MSLEMQEHLPGAMLTYQMVDKDYCELLQQVEKNANVMFQCCQEGLYIYTIPTSKYIING